jgi:cytochrome bd ubiquinol oxidase subunit II
MAAAAVGGILPASVTLYAVLGGADFGGGLWDLLAGGDRRGRAPRVDRGVDHPGVGRPTTSG